MLALSCWIGTSSPNAFTELLLDFCNWRFQGLNLALSTCEADTLLSNSTFPLTVQDLKCLGQVELYAIHNEIHFHVGYANNVGLLITSMRVFEIRIFNN